MVDSSDLPLALPRKGDSHRDIKYVCSNCGREVGKGNLRAKRAVFKELGVHGRTIKTRTSKWLCIIDQEDGSPSCLDRDPDWQLPSRVASPGMADVNPDRRLDVIEGSTQDGD